MKKEVKKWLIKAYEDFRVAKYLLSLPEDEVPTGAVCFHCQQFVEKVLKAFLISHGVEFGRIHNLSVIKRLCVEIDKDFDRLEVERLNIYAVEVRYPEEFFSPSVKESKRCFQLATTVMDFILKKFGISEEKLKDWAKEK